MDQQTFNLVFGLVSGLLTIIASGVAWWCKSIQTGLAGQQAQLVHLMAQISNLNIELAKNYAPRAELQGAFDRIFAVLDEIRKEVRHA
jgi:hypothetical protein